MSGRRLLIGVLGLLAGLAAIVGVVGGPETQDQAVPESSGPRTAEVRDAQGQVVLRGAFRLSEDEAHEVEWDARLEPTGVVADARGTAEVELDKPIGSGEHEIEFSLRGLPVGAAFALWIDGGEVAAGTADGRGRLEVERSARGAAAQAALWGGQPAPGGFRSGTAAASPMRPTLGLDEGEDLRACLDPRPIEGGTYEASGVVHVGGTAGVLFVDDDREREVFWMELDAAGAQRGPIVRVALDAEIVDAEGITTDGTYVYVIGSQSTERSVESDGLIRFRFDPQTLRATGVERIPEVKAWLGAQVPELQRAAREVGRDVLDIEALAWDPRSERLLLGLRGPLVGGDALVVPIRLRDGAEPFTVDALQLDGGAIRLPLGGRGLRSLEYDEAAGALRLIADAGPDDGHAEFQVLRWDGRDPASLTLLAAFPTDFKAEGVTGATIDGRAMSVVMFDTSQFLAAGAECWTDEPLPASP